MNFNILNVVMFGAGAILVYSAVMDKDPRRVVGDALNGKVAPRNTPKPSAENSSTTPEPATTQPPRPTFTVVSV